MRSQLILAAAILLAFGGLAGCVGGEKESGTNTPSTDPVSQTSLPGGTTPTIKVLAALNATIGIDAPEWVASGTEVPVTLTAPTNAKGAIAYTWALGPLPGTAAVTPAKADTGSATAKEYIQPGASKSITYTTSGIYRMHCHPHMWMRHNVTVIDGYAGPKAVEVLIVDGATNSDYRYVPENIVVGAGTVVTYKNIGLQPHTTTTLGTQEPALKKLPLSADKGNVKIEGNGWQRLVAVYTDSEGRVGLSEKSIYTTPTLPAFPSQSIPFEFTAGTPAPLAGTPAEAAPESAPVALAQAGTVFLNYTFSDGIGSASGGAENLAEVEVHFIKDGETQDTLTGDGAAGALSGKAQAGAYTIRVVPLQGAQVSGTVVVEVIYDLVPPAPTAPAVQDESQPHHH